MAELLERGGKSPQVSSAPVRPKSCYESLEVGLWPPIVVGAAGGALLRIVGPTPCPRLTV
jgi:hypothetical protein